MMTKEIIELNEVLMLKDLEMSVIPSYRDEQCTIIFSFQFRNEHKKLGEAVIYTGTEDFIEAQRRGLPVPDINKGERGNLETVAWLKQFAIVEEYKSVSLIKISEFIKMLGIKRSIIEEPAKQAENKITHSNFKNGKALKKQKSKPILFG